MKLILTILGCTGILYFIGITCYAGLSSMFPAVWAAAGVFCLGLAACLHLHETAGWFAGFVMPDWGVHVIQSVLLLCLVFFICVESFIVRGMYSEPKDNLDYIIVLGAQVKGTRPSRSLRFRLDRAETYLRENPQTTAVLSGERVLMRRFRKQTACIIIWWKKELKKKDF